MGTAVENQDKMTCRDGRPNEKPHCCRALSKTRPYLKGRQTVWTDGGGDRGLERPVFRGCRECFASSAEGRGGGQAPRSDAGEVRAVKVTFPRPLG